MGDVLDKLFSVLPIVLAILWVLRRTTRGKKKAAARSARAVSPGADADGNAMAGKGAAGVRSDPEPEKIHRVKESTPWPGSRVAAEEPRPVARPIPPPEEVERNVGASPTGDRLPNVVPGTLERLDRLSPLARGVLWSLILEPPPSLKEPGN